MSGDSTISLEGSIALSTSRAETELPLTTSVGGLEAKNIEVTVPPGKIVVPVPLPFGPGVNEALIVHLHSTGLLSLMVTSSSTTNPGPMELAIKGPFILFGAPGAAIQAITASNGGQEDVTLTVLAGMAVSANSIPDWWNS